ncbi:MAG: hypothetical protein R2852_00870 [Bacteroidia bacterium]
MKHIFRASISAIFMSCANEIPVENNTSNSIQIQFKEDSQKAIPIYNKLISCL